MSLGIFLSALSQHPLAARHRMRALVNLARTQTLLRLNGEVAFRFVDDSFLLASRGMAGLTGNAYFGLHEADMMAFCLHMLRPEDTFADIGANAGSYSILATKVIGARCISVEPGDLAVAALRRNLELNDVAGLCSVMTCIADERQTDRLFSKGGDTINHVVLSDSGTDAEATEIKPGRRMDDILAHQAPTLAKIDVEGFEHQVLKGFGAVLLNPDLKALVVEISADRNSSTGRSPATNLLEDAGFKPFQYSIDRRELVPIIGTLPLGNILFVRDAASVALRIQRARRFYLHALRIYV